MNAVIDFDQIPAPGPVQFLQELVPGPWRSLGKVLDYSKWPERDRFVELDSAIARLKRDHHVDAQLRPVVS